MRTISTGQPSTLGTYKGIARFFGQHAQDFIDDQIAKAPNGEDEEVVAEESQVLYLLANVGLMPDDARPDIFPKELFEI